MSEQKTTVNNTTLTSAVVALSPAAVQWAKKITQFKRAIRHLTRGTNEYFYLQDRIRAARYSLQSLMTRVQRTHVVTYNGQVSAPTLSNHGALCNTWKELRDRGRREIRNRRHTMREVMADRWNGFMRQWEAGPRPRVTKVTYLWGDSQSTTRCGVHMEANEIRRAYVAKLRARLFNSKAPLEGDTRRWVSVEIECVLGTKQEDLCDKLMQLNAARYVRVGHDSSIRRNDDDRTGMPTEIVVSAPKEEIEQAIKLACQALAECKAYVNKSCGLHIHLDMRNFDYRTAFSNLVAGQKILRSLVPEHRISSRYCKPVGRREWPVNTDRYKAINHTAWRKYRTLEVRLFAGCVDATKIIGYVKICSAMAYTKDAVKRAPSSPKGWQKANPQEVDTGLLNWIKSEAREITMQNEAERAAASQSPF